MSSLAPGGYTLAMKRLCASVLATLGTVIGGCAGPAPGEGDVAPGVTLQARAQEPIPNDFAIAVSVISPQGLRTRNLAPHQRAARYIMEPDWALRASVGRELSRVTWVSAGGADRTLPGFTRQLGRDQVARLWNAVQQSGVLSQSNPTGAPPASFAPPRDRLVYIVSCTAQGRRTWGVFDESEGRSAAAEPLVRELAALAFQE